MGLLDSIKNSLGISGIKKSSRGHVLGGSKGSTEDAQPAPQYNSGELSCSFFSLSVLLRHVFGNMRSL